MPNIREIERLRAEHAAIETLSRFLLALVAAPHPPRPTEHAAVRGMLRDTLVRHLKCEDWALYPRMQSSGDAEVMRIARIFVDEMGHIAGDFAAFAFTVLLNMGGKDMRVDVIDTFRFNEANEVIEMKAYFGPANMHGFT